ncbi:MAG TPA: DoxX family protein [Pseudonocardia sp.]|jgi:uncharacterized membrane protein YphA (DoxX/SURF4 family)
MLLRRIARPLLAGIFITGGIAALRDPKGHEQAARPVLDKVTELAPTGQPLSPLTMIRIDAGVKIGFGSLLAIGKFPRLSAAALATSLVPTTAAGHRFWEIDDPDRRRAEQIHFTKNLGLLGGLMLAAADTEGKPSLAWKARRAGHTSAAAAELFHRDVTDNLNHLGKRVGDLGGQVTDAAHRYGPKAVELGRDYGGQAAEVATKYGTQAADAVTEAANKYGPKAADAVTDAANKYGPKAVDAANKYGPKAVDAASRAGGRLAENTERLRAETEKRGAKKAKEARKAGKQARKRADKRLAKATKAADKRFPTATKKARKAAPSW